MYNYRDGEEVLKENKRSHFRKFVGKINRLELQFRNLEDPKEATLVVCTDTRGKGEAISKNLQEVCHEDNQFRSRVKRIVLHHVCLCLCPDMTISRKF